MSKPRPEFSHPVLRMMGIPRLRVPSRNMSIFLGISSIIAGAIWYDKRESAKAKAYWKEQVSWMANEPIGTLDVARKVKVYIAPPPNDFLDVALKYFKHNVKPILTAAAVDHEIISEQQQGHIREAVAEEIREKRRAYHGLPLLKDTPDELDNKINEKLNFDTTGGVICIGRGAYKEYINGVHEGWLGPLEKPAKPEIEEITPEVEPTSKPKVEVESKAVENESNTAEIPVTSLDSASESLSDPSGSSESSESSEPKSEAKKERDTPARYIFPSEYAESQTDGLFNDWKADPIAVIPQPHLLGFLQTPWRIARYFDRRYINNLTAQTAYDVVMNHSRPFTAEDVDLAISDESDWPKSWKQNGLDNKSEWMSELVVDDRIKEKLSVYDHPANH